MFTSSITTFTLSVRYTTPTKLRTHEQESRCGWLTQARVQHLLLTLIHRECLPSFVLQPCSVSLTHYTDMETICECTDASQSASCRSERFSLYRCSQKQKQQSHLNILRTLWVVTKRKDTSLHLNTCTDHSCTQTARNKLHLNACAGQLCASCA